MAKKKEPKATKVEKKEKTKEVKEVGEQEDINLLDGLSKDEQAQVEMIMKQMGISPEEFKNGKSLSAVREELMDELSQFGEVEPESTEMIEGDLRNMPFMKVLDAYIDWYNGFLIEEAKLPEDELIILESVPELNAVRTHESKDDTDPDKPRDTVYYYSVTCNFIYKGKIVYNITEKEERKVKAEEDNDIQHEPVFDKLACLVLSSFVYPTMKKLSSELLNEIETSEEEPKTTAKDVN